MNIADKWTIIDFWVYDIPTDVFKYLQEYTIMHYVDISSTNGFTENIYCASGIGEEMEDKYHGIKERTVKVLDEILKVCAENDAFYFRIIE